MSSIGEVSIVRSVYLYLCVLYVLVLGPESICKWKACVLPDSFYFYVNLIYSLIWSICYNIVISLIVHRDCAFELAQGFFVDFFCY